MIFGGMPDAVRAATYLYFNGPACGTFIADTGTRCWSPTEGWAVHHYTFGFGLWLKLGTLYDSLQEWFRLYQQRRPGQLRSRRSLEPRGRATASGSCSIWL